MKNLKKLKDYQLYKIHIPTSIECWDEFIIAKNDSEARLAQQLLNLEDKKLEPLSWKLLDNIYIFAENEN